MILDTNALSALADGDVGVENALRTSDEIAIPVVVIGEYRYGIRVSRHRSMYERWLVELIAVCRILNVETGTTGDYADVRNALKALGRPIPANDVWIAALARQHGLPILSRDQHFDHVPGLQRIAW